MANRKCLSNEILYKVKSTLNKVDLLNKILLICLDFAFVDL
jgi:hypothetical protein